MLTWKLQEKKGTDNFHQIFLSYSEGNLKVTKKMR